METDKKKKKKGSDQVTLVLLDQVHFVDEAKDFGLGRVLQDGLQTALVVMHVLLQLARLDIEDVDQHLQRPRRGVRFISHDESFSCATHLDVAEDVVALAGEVVLHEGLLAAAVPQVEHQVAQKANVRVLHVDLWVFHATTTITTTKGLSIEVFLRSVNSEDR